MTKTVRYSNNAHAIIDTMLMVLASVIAALCGALKANGSRPGSQPGTLSSDFSPRPETRDVPRTDRWDGFTEQFLNRT